MKKIDEKEKNFLQYLFDKKILKIEKVLHKSHDVSKFKKLKEKITLFKFSNFKKKNNFSDIQYSDNNLIVCSINDLKEDYTKDINNLIFNNEKFDKLVLKNNIYHNVFILEFKYDDKKNSSSKIQSITLTFD